MNSSKGVDVSGFHHVAVRVANLERSLALYRDTLGFELKRAFMLDGRRFAHLDTGNGAYVELVETQEAIHAGRQEDVIWHFAVRTGDIDRSLEEVVRGGYEVTRPVTPLDLVNTTTNQPFTLRVAFFRGPDGEDIELFEDPNAR